MKTLTDLALNIAEDLGASFADMRIVEERQNRVYVLRRSLKNIRKARRVVTKMVATITFFVLTVQAKVQTLTLTTEQEKEG